MTEERARQIVFEMIGSGFSEVNPRNIIIRLVKGTDAYMSVQWLIFKYILRIDREIMKYTESAFRGCLAHELAHIALLKKESWWLRFTKPLLSETEEERAADQLAIDRSFGADLLQFHKEHNKVYKSYKSNEGLTSGEIKRLMKAKVEGVPAK